MQETNRKALATSFEPILTHVKTDHKMLTHLLIVYTVNLY